MEGVQPICKNNKFINVLIQDSNTFKKLIYLIDWDD